MANRYMERSLTSSYKINSGHVMCSMVTTVNNTVLYT